MIEDIKYGDWVYMKDNQDIAYKVIRIHETENNQKAEILANNGVKKYEPITNLILITDVEVIHKLETQAGS